tara:strand:- start:207 stop:398 length:192 start_codon:yes stop_codon:yes gene_type:complete
METNNETLRLQALNVLEVIEDAVESICDTEVISGEKVWTMVYGLAEAKLEEFPIDYEEENDVY